MKRSASPDDIDQQLTARPDSADAKAKATTAEEATQTAPVAAKKKASPRKKVAKEGGGGTESNNGDGDAATTKAGGDAVASPYNSAFRAALLEMYLERGRVNMDKKAWQELGDLIGKTDVQVKDFWRKVFYPRLQKAAGSI